MQRTMERKHRLINTLASAVISLLFRLFLKKAPSFHFSVSIPDRAKGLTNSDVRMQQVSLSNRMARWRNSNVIDATYSKDSTVFGNYCQKNRLCHSVARKLIEIGLSSCVFPSNFRPYFNARCSWINKLWIFGTIRRSVKKKSWFQLKFHKTSSFHLSETSCLFAPVKKMKISYFLSIFSSSHL